MEPKELPSSSRRMYFSKSAYSCFFCFLSDIINPKSFLSNFRGSCHPGFALLPCSSHARCRSQTRRYRGQNCYHNLNHRLPRLPFHTRFFNFSPLTFSLSHLSPLTPLPPPYREGRGGSTLRHQDSWCRGRSCHRPAKDCWWGPPRCRHRLPRSRASPPCRRGRSRYSVPRCSPTPPSGPSMG